MVLGIKITYSMKEDAVQFQRFLRKDMDIDARVITQERPSSELYYSGSISAFETLIDNLSAKISKTEDSVSDETAFEISETEDDDFEDQDFEDLIDYLQETVTDRRNKFTKIYEVIEENGSVPSPNFEFLAEFIQKKQANEEFEVTDEIRSSIFGSISSYIYLSELEKNGVIIENTETDEYTLRNKIPVEDIVILVKVEDYFEEPDYDDLRDAGIQIQQKFFYDYEYVVESNPSVICINPEKIIEYLKSHRLAALNLEDELNDYQNKVEMVICIITLISEGDTTIDEIGHSLMEYDFSDLVSPDEPIPSFASDQAYLEQVLTEMKKIGIVSFKNNRYKIASSYVSAMMD